MRISLLLKCKVAALTRTMALTWTDITSGETQGLWGPDSTSPGSPWRSHGQESPTCMRPPASAGPTWALFLLFPH